MTPEIRVSGHQTNAIYDDGSRSESRSLYVIYAVLLAVSISVWSIAISSPLFLDETGSYWEIKDGLAHIWSQPSPSFPGYYYILGLSAKLIGTSEAALRIPSILAMLGALYLFYLAAREIFHRELALFAATIFCLDPIIIYGSIDARPYAFAMLSTNAAIFLLLRLRRTHSAWAAAGFGAVAALPLYFHTLFGALLPALALCFFLIKGSDRRAMWKQLGVGLSAFVVAFLPLVPRLVDLHRTSGTHVFEHAPSFRSLISTITLFGLERAFIAVLLVFVLWVLLRRRAHWRIHLPLEGWKIGVCIALAAIPLLLLFGISISTPLHLFVPRYEMSAIPGIALCWALAAGLLLPRKWVLGLAIVLVAFSAGRALISPSRGQHGYYSWKYALSYAEKDASADSAPLVVCSDYVESNYGTLETKDVEQDRYFAPLAYYRVTVPVVGLPKLMSRETVQIGTGFLEDASAKHQRFLALAYETSWPTLRWLAQQAAPHYTVKKLGVFSGVEVLEFQPRPPR